MYRLITIAAVALIISGCGKPDYQTGLRNWAKSHKQAMADATGEKLSFDSKKYNSALEEIDATGCPAEFDRPWKTMQESSKLIAGYGHDKHIMLTSASKDPLIKEQGLRYAKAMKELTDLMILYDATPLKKPIRP